MSPSITEQVVGQCVLQEDNGNMPLFTAQIFKSLGAFFQTHSTLAKSRTLAILHRLYGEIPHFINKNE